MPSYKFIGAYARFYPQERDANGRSLMAELGTVHDWAVTPDDGQWLLVEVEPDPNPEPGYLASEPDPVEPEPASAPDQAVLPVEPQPEVITPEAPVEPENVQVSAAENPAPEPVSPPDPEPAPAPAAPAPVPWSFPGFAPASQPYTR